MNREQAHEILMKYMKGENYITHSYAVEAIMRGLAKRLAPDDVEYWGIVGLLHDLDEEQCDWQHDMSVHGPTSVEILKKEGIDDKILFDAICSHNPKSGMKAKTTLQYAVLAADPMSGFVKAVAQIYPDKKIASVKHKSVMKRFNELRFAAGANRDYMEAIEFTGLSLDDLIDSACFSIFSLLLISLPSTRYPASISSSSFSLEGRTARPITSIRPIFSFLILWYCACG